MGLPRTVWAVIKVDEVVTQELLELGVKEGSLGEILSEGKEEEEEVLQKEEDRMNE